MNKEQQLIKNNIATSIESIKKQIQASRRDLITSVEAFEYSKASIDTLQIFLRYKDVIVIKDAILDAYVYNNYDNIDKLDTFINGEFEIDYSMFE